MASKIKGSASSFWRRIALLLATLGTAQFFIFVSILESKHSKQSAYFPNSDVKTANTVPIASDIAEKHVKQSYERTPNEKPEGVAITVMLRAPKWFHRRYPTMLHNALANIPSTWSLQVFYNEHWLEKDVLPLHPGLERLRSHPRIVWTPLLNELTKEKPKVVMKSKWLWESVIAENILTFTGNGVFCSNSKARVEDFLDDDFVGVPWGKFHGVGGDALSHSLRKRSDMIRILEKYPPETEMDSIDSHYFAKHLIDEGTAKMANVSTTVLFGGITEDIEVAPFVVAGTQAKLEFKRREALLHVCPELNIIFPSLHEPNCFGAHPDPEKCKATICALQDPLPGHGC